MKVLDLRCTHGHSFEGWFGSEADFQSQLSRQLVACPICADTAITKMLSAPRLNLGAAPPKTRETEVAQPEAPSVAPPAATGTSAASQPPAARTEVTVPQPETTLQAAWLNMVRHVINNTEDVGTQFAQEARKMHYGETQGRSIRGQATADEAEALIDEGIAVLPLPVPEALKGPVH